jgi:hypothetical protein
MGLVAVRTAHACVVHPALQKGPGYKDLVPDLAIGEVKSVLQKRQFVPIMEVATGTRS